MLVPVNHILLISLLFGGLVPEAYRINLHDLCCAISKCFAPHLALVYLTWYHSQSISSIIAKPPTDA